MWIAEVLHAIGGVCRTMELYGGKEDVQCGSMYEWQSYSIIQEKGEQAMLRLCSRSTDLVRLKGSCLQAAEWRSAPGRIGRTVELL